MQHLLDQSPLQTADWFARSGLPSYRAAQLRHWVFRRRAETFDEMTELPKALRRQLKDEFRLWAAEVREHQTSEDGTEKLLLELADGQRVECVLLRDEGHHRTACISTQVGCAMGCVFCASGLDGVVRDLSTGEILEQLLHLQRLLPDDERLSHVVVMGMGEPLANLDRLLAALAVATDRDGLGIGARRITISTVGLPRPLRRLAAENCPYHLAISLHAPDDALRNELVPANRKVGIAAILAAADDYFAATGRRVTYEYVLLSEINDRPRHARKLAALLQGRRALVNIIPYNPVNGLPYRAPDSSRTTQFADLLTAAGLTVKIRYRKGERIDAACGQLRRRASAQ